MTIQKGPIWADSCNEYNFISGKTTNYVAKTNDCIKVVINRLKHITNVATI